HADGIRVDAVASMLYLDYSRKEGEWVPNHFGGRENLEAVQFLREFNEAVYGAHPDTVTIAEESTSWPNVSRPTFNGGLGFGQKWMMGWMHDTLEYFTKEPVYRKFHQNEITFSFVYAFTENFMLPLSHDEVVHGKGAIIGRMPGDDWQRFANLRLLYGSMYMHPGTKLMFMGNEFGQQSEWKHDSSLDWFVLEYNHHRGVRNWVKALNDFYKSTPALYERQFEQNGFEWIDYSDHQNSVMAFARKGDKKNDCVVAILNFTPTHRTNYRIGMPLPGKWIEILNSDKEEFGGSNLFNGGDLITDDIYMHGRPQSLELNLSPMALMVFKLG
ncbi:MAG: 1,4-alpha-glucan branching enzyme, partial [Cyclobacteriaceae bacterium]|nr:1,4-alpha-glucan branching enzyme [Cyclobacteriaceae bacterium]